MSNMYRPDKDYYLDQEVDYTGVASIFNIFC